MTAAKIAESKAKEVQLRAAGLVQDADKLVIERGKLELAQKADRQRNAVMQAVADAGVMVSVAGQPLPLAVALADPALLARVETPTDKEKLVLAYAKVKGMKPDEARVALNEKSSKELLTEVVRAHLNSIHYSGSTPEDKLGRSQALVDEIGNQDPDALFDNLMNSWGKSLKGGLKQ